MEETKVQHFIRKVLLNIPEDWLKLTTHRLDIFNEKLAKTEFLDQFESLYQHDEMDLSTLGKLPTAFDYIRLGHPLSCVLEWLIGKSNDLHPKNVICFSSKTIPILAILRKNLLDSKNTVIYYQDEWPESFDADIVKKVYGYNFEVHKVESLDDIQKSEGSNILISNDAQLFLKETNQNVDFFIKLHPTLGSIIIVSGKDNEDYVSEIQHVRRRESIAMTPAHCKILLEQYLNLQAPSDRLADKRTENKAKVSTLINEIAGTNSKVLLSSSGLSVQYAILMGLVDDASERYPTKKIKIIVPPNCYGGTNDQARRVAACIPQSEIIDLLVDDGFDMVQSIDAVLDTIAKEDAVPLIIAEIPTNPRVEVPNLHQLREVLAKHRKTNDGQDAVDPIFILDQTFCPNVHFLGEDQILSSVRTIAFASGSKFPSGGLCTAGYCIGNDLSQNLLSKIESHLKLCDNEATDLQIDILAHQMPSMIQRIADAYENTRAFVSFIQKQLPAAKINFVSETLADEGFTPSVFSLDLPTKGDSEEDRESYKRSLNLKLINMMITEIPDQSKFCVSYGQLKGCYWTIPATSTQGTTKEGDKDYIVRASLSPDLDLEKHKQVFSKFVEGI